MRELSGIHGVKIATRIPGPGSRARRLFVADPVSVLHARVVRGSGGGPDKTILRSMRHASTTGYAMGAAYMRHDRDADFDAIRSQAQRWRCPLFEVRDRGPLDPGCFTEALRLCRAHDVRIWHGHDYKSNLIGLALRRWHAMKLVTTVHGWTWDTRRTRLYHHVDNLCLRHYDEVITVSRRLLDHCRDHGVAHERLSLVTNAIDPVEFRRRGAVDTEFPRQVRSSDALAIGVVGRLSIEKGADRALELLSGLLHRGERVNLHLVGDGPEATVLRSRSEALGIADKVHFHGWHRDARPFYESVDVLLLPSRTEGSPNAVLEAMAMEVPVAATDVGSVRELLDDGRCGVVLGNTDDTDGWMDAILSLTRDVERRGRFARAGRRRVLDHYSFDRRMHRVYDVYDRVAPELAVAREPLRRAA
ncbi:MAG: glycosyl transferase family 1 [Phycisphaeraceae bacterium]|nr:glycosyl transferase family 1 [Phycisphaeraceae bacterium]